MDIDITGEIKRFDYRLKTLVLGLGSSGYSCMEFLTTKNCPFDICDTRPVPPNIEKLRKEFPQQNVRCEPITIELLEQYQQVIVSPGISIRQSAFSAYLALDRLLIGDVELFAQELSSLHELNDCQTKVVAITGSNGKSTVTTMVEHIAQQAGLKALAGGNLGLPVLDMLKTEVDIYVLELSSFQLETLYSLTTESAVVLNISEDHMDRYDDLMDYQAVKEKIYRNCRIKVLNLDEPLSEKYQHDDENSRLGFTMNKPQQGQFGLIENGREIYLVKAEDQVNINIMSSQELKVKGRHNIANALAAMALLNSWKIPTNILRAALKSYKGLPHRCEWVREVNGVTFFNDSKGTNVGATIAAINGFDEDLILIAGGQGKGADFRELAVVVRESIKTVLLFGEDAKLIDIAITESGSDGEPVLEVMQVENLHQAVNLAYEYAQPGMNVLFSPACASFDQYKNFIERGEDFIKWVKALE